MGTEESEQVMVLLKELSVLKELNRERAASSQEDGQSGRVQLSEERQQQIGREIKELAAQKKKNAEQS